MSRGQSGNIIFNVAVFICLEVASLCILGSANTLQGTWMGGISTGIKASMWGGIDRWKGYFSLRSENDSLRLDNLRMYARLQAVSDSIAHNPQKWSEARRNFSFLPAGIVTMTLGSQHNYIIIDRGSTDGVSENDGLVTEKGVVGIVQSVSEHFARAVSYVSDGIVISIKVGRCGTVGSMAWNGGDASISRATGIPLHIPVEAGDTVYTSGMSEFFPAGIPLGRVIRKVADNGSSTEMDVEMLEDIRSVHKVLVVKNLDKKELEALEQ